jgi:hypothetical protein
VANSEGVKIRFAFWHRSGMRTPSSAVLQALGTTGRSSGPDVAALRMVQTPGQYAGRRVTYFRVFDPKRVATHAVNPGSNFRYDDLNPYLPLVLFAGHVEQDGMVVLAAPLPAWEAAAPARQRADRATHQDDEQVVFPGKDPSVEVPA